jgi:Protein of unknown function (DUF551)
MMCEQEWIDVKDAVPTIPTKALGYLFDGRVAVVYYHPHSGHWLEVVEHSPEVTHWRPLPEPPAMR